jgi:hypothetical protein
VTEEGTRQLPDLCRTGSAFAKNGRERVAFCKACRNPVWHFSDLLGQQKAPSGAFALNSASLGIEMELPGGVQVLHRAPTCIQPHDTPNIHLSDPALHSEP